MQFLTLTIENFGSIEEVTLDLNNRGLVLVLGQNEDAAKADSNGSGKSLLLEALCWGLWGKTIRGGDFSGDGVVNKQVGKDCRVTVSFHEGGCMYRVVRTRKYSKGKPNDLKLWYQPDPSIGNFLDLTSHSMAATQEFINTILGVDFDTFCVMMPGAGRRASEMTDKQVKELLERLLQTQVLGKAHDTVKQRLKQTTLEKTKVESSYNHYMSSIEECESRLEDLKEKHQNYELNKQSSLEDLECQINDCKSKLEEQEEIIKNKQKIADDRNRLEEKVARLQENLNNEHRLFNKVKESVDSTKNKLESKRSVLVSSNNNLHRYKNELPSGGNCPTCQQEVDSDHIAKVTKELDDEIASKSAEILEISAQIEVMDNNIRERREAFIKTDKEIRQQIQLLESDITRFKKQENRIETALALKENIKNQIAGLVQQFQRLQQEENPYGVLMEQTAKEAYEKSTQASRALKSLHTLQHKEGLLQYWVTGFGPQGVRSFMLEHVTPLLNQSAKKYADLLTDGEMSVTFNTQQRQKSGKVVEKFNISVEHDHGGGSYSSASAGEKSRANLVVAFALGDLASLRANKTISFRFLDEPFENVDESGTDAIVALLNDQKERFDTVFVVTHQDHFKQLFPTQLSVVKKNGMTTVGEHG